MGKLAPHPSAVNGTAPAPGATREVPHDVGDLAVEMRSMVTPVIGYLELISDEGEPLSPDRHLKWIATIEQRLEAIQELNEQIARTCAVLRDSVDDRGAAMPPGPEALED
jgi:hypothetical protein